MFPKIDSSPNKQKPQPKDENVREEAQLEENNSVQPMGNEAANIALMNQMLKEANADNELDLGEYIDQDQIIGPGNNEGNAHLEQPGADDPNNSMYLNSSHNIVNDNNFINDNIINNPIDLGGMREKDNDLSGSEENLLEIDTRSDETKKKEKEAKLKEAGGKAPVQNIIAPVIQAAAQAANAPAQQEAEKPEFYQDPEGPDWDSLDPENPLNRDMVVEAPRKRRKGKGKKKSSKSKKSGNALNQINNDMQPVAGWNFNAQKLPARKKAGWFSRFLTGLSYYAGKTIGKTLNFLGNLLYVPLSGSFGKLWRGRAGNKENANVTQETRDHETIPGWNGAKYEKGPGKNNEVIADFRRVPTVWSYLTAAPAEDDKGNPLPPKVGVYVDQPKEGADKDIDWINFGHSGIGIEYSRYSRQTQRYERYSLRYGFYQAGATVSGGILTNSANVIVPGQLKDENEVEYTVSRKFTATAKQVNDILNASETWADKGYNAATRNCTSFVKEMVRDVAHLPLANDIFTEDHIRLSSLGNFGYFGSTASETNAKMGMESQFSKLGQQEDKSYAGFGNMRYTRQEYRQYKDSLEQGVNRITTADTPNGAAENMRRLSGKYAGEIGSYSFTGTIPQNPNKSLNSTYIYTRRAIDDAGAEAAQAIRDVTGKTHEQLMAMTTRFPELIDLYSKLNNRDVGLVLYDVTHNEGDPEILRMARKEINQYIESLNKLLYDYFKNDKRLHIPIMHVISLLNRGAAKIDRSYNKADRGQNVESEVGDVRGNMYSNEYKISAGDSDAFMTPSHYESYLQIYGSPEEAVKQYARLQELRETRDNPDQELTDEGEKDLKKLERIDELANQFDQSHRYMLEKSSYSQQDVDYAFALSKKERGDGEASGAMIDNDKTAGNVYQTLILEKIFGGMKQRYLSQFKTLEQGDDIPLIQEWLDNDLVNCIHRKRDDFIAVIRAIIHNLDQKDQEQLIYAMNRMMYSNWFVKAFPTGDKNGPLARGPNMISEAFSRILQDNGSRFNNELTGISKFLFSEDKIAKPDSRQKAMNPS